LPFLSQGIYVTHCSKLGLILNIACELWHIWSPERWCYIDGESHFILQTIIFGACVSKFLLCN
jgi:hypothetical protein